MSDSCWPGGKKAALTFSFDDARCSQIDCGMSLLGRLGVRGTFYVSPHNYTERLDGWRRAASDGHEIGNHTISHPCSCNYFFSSDNGLEEYDLQRMELEIVGANDMIRRDLGVTPVTFAYPCGEQFVGRGEQTHSYVPLVARHFLAGRGFAGYGFNDPLKCDLFKLQSQEADCASFEPLKAQVDIAAGRGQWLILTGHEIGDGGQGTFIAGVLEQLIEYARQPSLGVWIGTVSEIASHLKQLRRQ